MNIIKDQRAFLEHVYASTAKVSAAVAARYSLSAAAAILNRNGKCKRGLVVYQHTLNVSVCEQNTPMWKRASAAGSVAEPHFICTQVYSREMHTTEIS
jgi:hypothetical protein